MTQVYGEGGKSEAITAIEAGPCTVTQIKTEDSDGYSAVQLGFGEVKKSKKAGRKNPGEVQIRARIQIRRPQSAGRRAETGR